jgi:uncharacterized membrane protein YhaH (DUF805 family)
MPVATIGFIAKFRYWDASQSGCFHVIGSIASSIWARKMSDWLQDNLHWSGRTSRTKFRQWLLLIIAFEILMTWMVWEYGKNGRVNTLQFQYGLALFLLFSALTFAQISFEARRLKTAGFSRKWLILALFAPSLPLGETHLNLAMAVNWVIIAVCTLAPDVPEVADQPEPANHPTGA